MNYKIIQVFTDDRLSINDEVIGKQKVAYIEVNGSIHVVRYDYEIGTPEDEVNTALNKKIDDVSTL